MAKTIQMTSSFLSPSESRTWVEPNHDHPGGNWTAAKSIPSHPAPCMAYVPNYQDVLLQSITQMQINLHMSPNISRVSTPFGADTPYVLW
jgi:hypothetical protein